jgi:O-acetylhomoserine (thiol)-lyase
MTPHNAYLQLLGLETLSLRVDRYSDNALNLAEFLAGHKKIKSVNYPALQGHKYQQLVQKQYNGKAGSLVTFELESQEACFRFMNNLQMILRATNLCDNKSLIIHPWSTIYCEYNDEEKTAMKLTDCMLRLSVGIEDLQDIIEDIQQALEK